MTRTPVGRFGALFLIFTAAAAATIQSAATAQAQRESRERHVFASVVDKNNTPVAGLGIADFTVTEDNAAREVLKVAPATAPMQIALLIDNSDITEPLIADLRKATSAFVQKVLAASPTTEILVMTVGERPITATPFTSSAIPLLKATGSLFQRQGSGSYLLDGIAEVCKAITKHGSTRPVIVAFASEEGPEFAQQRHARIIESLKAAGATLWSVTYQPPGGGATRYENTAEGRERMDVLNSVANDSGGENKAVLTASALEPAFTTLATMLTSEYDVTYSRPVSLVPPQKLAVVVKTAGVRLWAPHWAGQ